MGDKEADLLETAIAGRAVNGDWWQIVYSKGHPGLSYVSIGLAETSERHAMDGISFDERGKRRSRWSSDAIALRTTTPIEVYYFWRGTVFTGEAADVISGVGRFRFDSVGREGRPMEAEGLFTMGTESEFEFGTAAAVELVRFTDEESRDLAESPTALARLAQEAFEHLDVTGRLRFHGV